MKNRDYTSPDLFSRSKKGELRVWCVMTEGGTVTVRFGKSGGALTEHGYAAEPKNVGRANATTATEQAVIEAKALVEHKLARKYALTPADAQEELDHLPMLAKKWNDKTAVFPGIVQRKYDGFRCMARRDDTGKIVLTSRQGKDFELPHITAEIEELPLGWVLDGELYCHGMTLQQIASLVKRPREESKAIRYIVYDLVNEHDATMSQKDRLAFLQQTLQPIDAGHAVSHAESFLAANKDSALVLQQKFIEEGYEGAIFRNASGVYRYAYRSDDLLKLKSFEDDEFEIVDVVDKKLPGLAIFVCRCGKGKTFEVVKKGGHDDRRRDFGRRSTLRGCKLTVRYAYLTADGVPFHPVGIIVRDVDGAD